MNLLDNQGLTLMEIIIAIALLSVVALAAMRGLQFAGVVMMSSKEYVGSAYEMQSTAEKDLSLVNTLDSSDDQSSVSLQAGFVSKVDETINFTWTSGPLADFSTTGVTVEREVIGGTYLDSPVHIFIPISDTGGGSGATTAPSANDIFKITTEGIAVDVILTGNDPDGNPVTYLVTTEPSNGSRTGIVPNLTYTPDSGFTGSDSFNYTVNDGTENSGTATVMIMVNAITSNNLPVATNQTVTCIEDGSAVGFILTATDPDGDSLTYIITENFSNGDATLSGIAPNLSIVGKKDGTYTLDYTVTDDEGTSDSATVTIIVQP